MVIDMESKKQPKIIVFSTPTCSHCNNAKAYFRQSRIKFRDIDVSRDQAAARDMVRRTGQQGVPVILINNRPIVGFDKGKIEKMLWPTLSWVCLSFQNVQSSASSPTSYESAR